MGRLHAMLIPHCLWCLTLTMRPRPIAVAALTPADRQR